MADFVLSQTAEDVQKAINNALNPDTTLTESGKPADSKAVGDAIREMSESMGDDVDTRLTALEERFDNLDYGDGIVISSFTHNQTGTRERGAVIDKLTLTWKFDRKPASHVLTGPKLDGGVSPEISGKDYSYPISDVAITADNQGSFRWKIAATDSRGKNVSRSSPGFTFLNCVYYGMAEDPGAITDQFIRSLKTKTAPTDLKGRTIIYEGDGTYMWYCVPVSLGECTFTCDGFPSFFELKGDAGGNTFLFTNALGYTEPYYVYRSEYPNSKTLTMVVT